MIAAFLSTIAIVDSDNTVPINPQLPMSLPMSLPVSETVPSPAKLDAIPVIQTGPDFPFETLQAERTRAHDLLDGATRGTPVGVLRALDGLSRRWLIKTDNPAVAEIDRIANELGRPGVYFLSVNYEWGCTTAVQPKQDGGARLVRVLDWRTPGLGRHVIAADVNGAGGRFFALTWPGYTGVLQACAPGRFAGAINQAPMRHSGGGIYPLDWLVNRVRVWRTRHDTPAHVLRRVFESAPDFNAARRQLVETPIASPAIFALAGLATPQLCVIERTETEARVYDGPSAAANAWRTPGWCGRARGTDNAARVCAIQTLGTDAGDAVEPFAWLGAPVLNAMTRLALVAEPGSGRFAAQGFEMGAPATLPLVVWLET